MAPQEPQEPGAQAGRVPPDVAAVAASQGVRAPPELPRVPVEPEPPGEEAAPAPPERRQGLAVRVQPDGPDDQQPQVGRQEEPAPWEPMRQRTLPARPNHSR